MKPGLLFLALFAVASLHATQKSVPADPATSSSDRSGRVCENKRELGSNRMKRVCTTESERAAAKQKAQAKLQELGSCSGNETPCTGEL